MLNKAKYWQMFWLGLLSGLAFAPTFLFPALLSLSLLCFYIKTSPNFKTAAILGFIFGLGHFLSGIYWIAIGVSVYIEDFWWLIPFALLGFPIILGIFIGLTCLVSWFFRKQKYYQLFFCLAWVFFEWLRSWIFTGLPWNLLGYSLSFSTILIQSTSLVGVYGLSFMVVYFATNFYSYFERDYKNLKISIIINCLIILTISVFGVIRLYQNPTVFSEIKVRVVQPSIKQEAKWNPQYFWDNLNAYIDLSRDSAKTDLIIWSEAALTLPYDKHPEVFQAILDLQYETNAILITGNVSEEYDLYQEKIYTSMVALDKTGDKLFEYRKVHLVPFGEYIPFKHWLPIKKITDGIIDYSPGTKGSVKINHPFNLSIRPLICYEAVFPSEVRISNKHIDAFINITNDAWYGQSSGPYQHLYISIMRAVENGIPLVRSANNGISASIDPCGRIIASIPLNARNKFDSFLPKKIEFETLYSRLGNIVALFAIFFVMIIQALVLTFMKFLRKL